MRNITGSRKPTRTLTVTMPDGTTVVRTHRIANSTSCDYDWVVVSRSSEERGWSVYSWSRYEQTAYRDAVDLRSGYGAAGIETRVLPVANVIDNAPAGWQRWCPRVRSVAE